MTDQHPSDALCAFCSIARDDSPVELVEDWPEWGVFAIQAPEPLTPGHVLVIPYDHASDVGTDPMLAGRVMVCAGMLAGSHEDAEVITSRGFGQLWAQHMCMQVIPRRVGDGVVVAGQVPVRAPVPRQHHPEQKVRIPHVA